jgi:hypothetical protein
MVHVLKSFQFHEEATDGLNTFVARFDIVLEEFEPQRI